MNNYRKFISNSKLFVVLCLILSLLISFTGCGASEPASSQSSGEQQKLVIGYGRDFYYGPEDISFVHMSTNIWESLTALDDNLEVQPVLLESWQMEESGKVWIFKIKKDVKFHDDTILDANVVIENINLHLSTNPETKAIYSNIENLEKLDPYTIEITLKEPQPLFPNLISSFNSPIFSTASFNEDGTIKYPYGTGAYKLKDYASGEYILLEKFADYYGAKGQIEEIEFRTIKDANARTAALISGQIDAIADVGAILPEQAAALSKEPGINLYSRPVATSHYMFFNTNRQPFNDQNLRQAVSMSLDRYAIVTSVVEGYGSPGASVITPLAQKWFCADAAPVFDIEKAQRLCRNNNYESTVTILVNSSFVSRWPYKPIAEIVLSRLQELGLNGEIKVYEGGAFNDELQSGNYDIAFHPYTLMTGEPNFYFHEWLHSEGSMNISRNLGVNDPEFDKLIESAQMESDENIKIQKYNELQIKARDAAVMVPLYHEENLYAARDNVKELHLNSQFKPDLASIRME